LFNNLVQPPSFLHPAIAPVLIADAEVEGAPLLSDDALDETARLPADLGTSGFDVVPQEGHGATRRQT
jgi:hypothetical protein